VISRYAEAMRSFSRALGPFAGVALGGCVLVIACSSSTPDDPGGGTTSGSLGEGGTSGTSGASGDGATDGPLTTGETPCDPAKTDCKPTEVCTDVGRAAPVCRAGCATEAECMPPKTSCVLLAAGKGACAATCTPFGTDCPPGFTCTAHAPEAAGVTQTSKLAFCRKAGGTALGAGCVDDPASCGVNAECLFFPDKGEGVPQSRCHSLCDATHPCGAGTGNCITKTGEKFGFCDG
jgi:hypothetical protein